MDMDIMFEQVQTLNGTKERLAAAAMPLQERHLIVWEATAILLSPHNIKMADFALCSVYGWKNGELRNVHLHVSLMDMPVSLILLLALTLFMLRG